MYGQSSIDVFPEKEIAREIEKEERRRGEEKTREETPSLPFLLLPPLLSSSRARDAEVKVHALQGMNSHAACTIVKPRCR
jgi:hypothetical protein